MRTQPPGFRWLAGGCALVAAIALGWRYLTARDAGDLLFAVVCLAAAGYWLVIDREPVAAEREPVAAEREPVAAEREPERDREPE